MLGHASLERWSQNGWSAFLYVPSKEDNLSIAYSLTTSNPSPFTYDEVILLPALVSHEGLGVLLEQLSLDVRWCFVLPIPHTGKAVKHCVTVDWLQVRVLWALADGKI